MTTENFARPTLALMGTGKGYPLSTNEFIRDWLAREWFARGRTAADLARELKLTEATVSNFRNRKRGAGYELVTGCAKLMGVTRDEPGDPSKAWWVSRIASEIDVTRNSR